MAVRLVLAAALAVLPLRAASAADAEAGARLFGRYCAACHGADGRGKPDLRRLLHLGEGTMDLGSERVRKRGDAELAADICRMQSKKPGFQGADAFSERDCADAVAYLRELADGRRRPEAAAAPVPAPGRGAAVYVKACAPCHGERGGGIFADPGAPEPIRDTRVVDLRSEEPASEPEPRRPMALSFEGGLSPEDLAALRAYIGELGANKEAP